MFPEQTFGQSQFIWVSVINEKFEKPFKRRERDKRGEKWDEK